MGDGVFSFRTGPVRFSRPRGGQPGTVGVGSGSRPTAPPLVEAVAVADAVATGATVCDDGVLCWVIFWAERRPAPAAEPERVVTARVCVPSAQYPRVLRMLGTVNVEEDCGEGLH